MKKSPTEIHSIRVKRELKNFFNSLPNANKFLVELVENSAEFQAWQKVEKAKDDSPLLQTYKILLV